MIVAPNLPCTATHVAFTDHPRSVEWRSILGAWEYKSTIS